MAVGLLTVVKVELYEHAFLNLGPRRLILITASQMCCRPKSVVIHFPSDAGHSPNADDKVKMKR